ncbi:protein kinase domain-containing protein [Singulisphaera sp. PoT]|uniref:bifunctional serine/threonine-protein kinase/formylglycine-generating enzyme family protein n=1 Tax=Singulisphaera sp. PoT TaxID=3411797 RepID=UPI003BF5C7CA
MAGPEGEKPDPRTEEHFSVPWPVSDDPQVLLDYFRDHTEAGISEKLAWILADQQFRWEQGDPFASEIYFEALGEAADEATVRATIIAAEEDARRRYVLNPTSRGLEGEDRPDGDGKRAAILGDFTTIAERSGMTQHPLQSTEATASLKVPTPPRPALSRSPELIGRYRVSGILGVGGFGRVYLAQDEILDRSVAVKVPHPHRVSRPEDVEQYLDEARILASLDHPNIVPVYDVGRPEDGACFVVSKLIEGSSLSAEGERLAGDFDRVGRLVAEIASALEHAHQRGLAHRDVKPSNILIDGEGRAHLVDFGLALREDDVGKGNVNAGTPAYMSPEQARGEGHRVDGRTDIFSLGVVLYELITGRHPFGYGRREVIMERIATLDPTPPRQFDETIPRELERICLRCLAKRVSDRYATAKDFADDLYHFLEEPSPTPAVPPRPGAGGSGGVPTRGVFESSNESEWRAPVIPRGLRAFDESDATAFLQLLPGPRDRDGLSEAIRFWKNKIEEPEAENTFPVGLIYGPSGCGKSSLVKAGLLPRLAPQVVKIYFEATGDDLEDRLLERLRRRFPTLDPSLGLAESLAAIRRGSALLRRSKLLLVLDQFEQWLHARRADQAGELTRALRQCDGGRLQALIMVRDDFWMASSRLMRELEVKVVDGHNAAAVDLFSIPHARRVLIAFGQAFGTVPARSSEFTTDQRRFLDRAVEALAQEGKVIPVRLALFAEMIKGKPWGTETLRKLGGAVGVGVTFLEETFATASAPPEHQHHQVAARAVLGSLLPEAGADIKGHMRSREAILEASGYRGAPDDFEALMRILDSQTRLLTPIVPESPAEAAEIGEAQAPSSAAEPPMPRYYQLTHDYLVPPIREWLTRKRKETWRGRVELRLEERAGLWNAKPETKQLPSFLEWCEILAATTKRRWSDAEAAMMRVANRHHLLRAGGVAVGVFLVGLAGARFFDRLAEEHENAQARALVRSLIDAKMPRVLEIAAEIGKDRRRFDHLLRDVVSGEANPSQKLHARIALLPVDAEQTGPLFDHLLECDPESFPVIRDALYQVKERVTPRLWEVCRAPAQAPQRRLHAAAALATFDSRNPLWEAQAAITAEQLTEQPSLHVPHWVEALRPIKDRILPRLTELFHDQTPGLEAERARNAEILADYAGNRPGLIADLIQSAHPVEFPVLFAKLQEQPDPAIKELKPLLAQATQPGRAEVSVLDAKHASNLAAALMRLGRTEEVWPLLKATPRPQLRSFLIKDFARLGVDPGVLAEKLLIEAEISTKSALIEALAEYSDRDLPAGFKDRLRPILLDLYENAPERSIHGASTILLKRWGFGEDLTAINARLAGKRPDDHREWLINSQRATMIHIPSPVRFQMGSPPDEQGRVDGEDQHPVLITHAYDIGATEVTVREFRAFLEDERNAELRETFAKAMEAPPDHPITRVSWFDALRYCNWLNEKEGMPTKEWPYVPPTENAYQSGLKLEPDYLRRTGYRLPSEAEWEFACRGGTVSSRFFGEATELLSTYANNFLNSDEKFRPVGSFLPNEFGLFDIQGNTTEWCLENTDEMNLPAAGVEVILTEDQTPVTHETKRMIRGTQVATHPRNARSARRYHEHPGVRSGPFGFRLARSRPLPDS